MRNNMVDSDLMTTPLKDLLKTIGIMYGDDGCLFGGMKKTLSELDFEVLQKVVCSFVTGGEEYLHDVFGELGLDLTILNHDGPDEDDMTMGTVRVWELFEGLQFSENDTGTAYVQPMFEAAGLMPLLYAIRTCLQRECAMNIPKYYETDYRTTADCHKSTVIDNRIRSLAGLSPIVPSSYLPVELTMHLQHLWIGRRDYDHVVTITRERNDMARRLGTYVVCIKRIYDFDGAARDVISSIAALVGL